MKQVRAAGGVRVSFAATGGGLRLQRPDLFELYDGRRWANASAARVSPSELLVAGRGRAVRYAWYNRPCPPRNDAPRMPADAAAAVNCSLYGGTMLPAPPFLIHVTDGPAEAVLV